KLEEIGDAVAGHKPGDKLTFTVQRDKATMDIVVTLELRPEGGQALPGVYLGLQTEGGGTGLRVAAVTPDGPADKAGLQAGDLLLTIDKKEIKEEQQIFNALREKKVGDKMALEVMRGDQKKDLTATLAARPAGPQQAGERRPY